jgi:hypothetical protein
MEINKIHIIDTTIIVSTLIIFVSMIIYAGYLNPLVIAPSNDFVTGNTSILFSFENAESILIDDNPEFTSPETINVKDSPVVRLAPGTYYWKVQGVLKSEIRKLTILSEVNLKLKKSEQGYEVVNSGNVALNVEVYDNETLAGKMILEVDESKNVSGTKFIGGQAENEQAA